MRQQMVMMAKSTPSAYAGPFAMVIVGVAAILWVSSCREKDGPTEEPTATASDLRGVPLWKPVPPPDLSGCTRLEITYWPSAFKAVCVTPREEVLLDPAETAFLKSLESPLVVDDAERIRAFAEGIALTSYNGPFSGGIATKPVIYIVCYRGNSRLTSLRIAGPHVFTEDGMRFAIKSNGGFEYLTPRTAPFEFRVNCARNLWKMCDGMREFASKRQTYPAQDAWCDILVREERLRRHIGTHVIPWLACPSASDGHSTYGINPSCEPNSPGDTVLLFETQVGWNEHGGPELFTFDNHKPKGGCVLLNDGTVRFIRTEEDLHALRWGITGTAEY